MGDLLQMKKAQILRKYPLLPLISQTDYGKDQFEQHLFYVGLQQFRDSNNGMYPSPTSAQDANDVYSIFEKLSIDNGMECKESEKMDKIKTKYTALARCASAVINPMCAFLGGIVAQEVLKACSHKFCPLQQLLYFDAFECLPKDITDLESEYAAQNCRYDANIAVFGKTVQSKVFQSRVFLVGAGAIGCEMLKNWALMGVGCDSNQNGSVCVTDMDQIETSNLNRQFLFRKKDIGKAKSVCSHGSAANEWRY